MAQKLIRVTCGSNEHESQSRRSEPDAIRETAVALDESIRAPVPLTPPYAIDSISHDVESVQMGKSPSWMTSVIASTRETPVGGGGCCRVQEKVQENLEKGGGGDEDAA